MTGQGRPRQRLRFLREKAISRHQLQGKAHSGIGPTVCRQRKVQDLPSQSEDDCPLLGASQSGLLLRDWYHRKQQARHGGPHDENPRRQLSGRTCLKWGVDGGLTSLDLELVLQRLAQVDQDVAALRQETLDRDPCPSIS